MRVLFSPLYPIVDAGVFGDADPGPVLGALAAAGIRTAQLRSKEMGAGAFHAWVRAGVRAAAVTGLRVIVNDRADVALLAGAAGVHLGQEDLSPRRARALLGEEAIIGLSTHCAEQVLAGAAAPVDYLAMGPVFATRTKPDTEPRTGLAGVREARRLYDGPLVAIGGIDARRLSAVRAAGADAAAVISALGVDPGAVRGRAAALLERAAPSGGEWR